MANNEKVLSIVIPCYNEENSILDLVKKVLESPVPNKEIIVVDDCSKDGTRTVLERDVKPLVSKIVYHEVNQGKGGALKTGFAAATGSEVIFAVQFTSNPIFNDEADVVYGSRFKESKMKGYLANRMANWFLTRLSNLFTHLKCTDMETCYKAFKREIIQSVDIQEKRFGFEPEITAKVAKMNVRFKEVPISYYPRTNEEGKKIGFSDGVRAIYCIWRYRK